MGELRDAARAWLAEQICASAVEADGRALDPPCGSCIKRADAILNAPGVEVEQHHEHRGALICRTDPDDPATTHTQVVIRLPVQPIGKTP